MGQEEQEEQFKQVKVVNRRPWFSRLNLERLNSLKAQLNAALPEGEKSLTQDDAMDHLFKCLRELSKMKQDYYELLKKVPK